MGIHRKPISRKRQRATGASIALTGALTLPLLFVGSAQAAVDRTPPTVKSVTPASNATNVGTDATVSADFSEAMNTKVLPTFLLMQGSKSVKGTEKWADSDTLTITPASALLANTSYSVALYGAQDLAKNTSGIKIWSFKTAAGTVVTPPTTAPTTAPTTTPPTTAPTTAPTTTPPTTVPVTTAPTTTPPTTVPVTTAPTTAPTTVPPTTTPPTTAPTTSTPTTAPTTVAPTTTAPTTPGLPNLLANGDVEAGSTSPTSWSFVNWGSANVHGTGAWTSSAANTGAKGLSATVDKVTTSNGGAAEWESAAIPVTPGKTYTFQDSYKSNITTYVNMELVDASGNDVSSVFIAPVAPSIEQDGGTGTDLYQWGTVQSAVTVPAGSNAVAARFFHTIYDVGFLNTDNYSLTDGAPVVVQPTAGSELITNGGFEQYSGNAPAAWSPGGYGTNTATSTYVTGGAHTGTKSARVDVSNWVSGDAKWVPTYFPVTGNGYYTYSDWYKSSADSAVTMGFQMADGTVSYANLFLAIPPAANWTQFSSGINAPSNAVKAFFIHFLPRNGYLQIDDTSAKQATNPAGFSRATVTLGYDDGSPSIYTNALPLLDSLGLKSTQFVPTGDMVTAQNPDGYVWSAAQIKSVSQRGHEIGGHTVTHPDLTCTGATDPCLGSTGHNLTLSQEITQNKTSLQTICSCAVNSFATPFGSYNSTVLTAIQAAGYTNHRSVDTGYNTKYDFNKYDIHVQNIKLTTTVAEFKSWVDFAIANKYNLNVVFHEVSDVQELNDDGTAVDPGDSYRVTVANHKAMIDYLKSTGVAVITQGQAVTELTAQQ